MVRMLAEVYPQRVILASDTHGVVLARGNAARGPASLGPESSPAFADLLAGKPLTGLVPVNFADGPGYALASAEPVRGENGQVGAIALLTPMTAAYLEYLEPKLNADLSLRVNEKVVAACADHPAPDLESHADTAVLKEVGRKLFALKTFRPEKLQRPDMEVELTASRDVTELRDQVRRELLLHLGGLGARPGDRAGAGAPLRLANGRRGAIASPRPRGQVKDGKYVSAPIVHTGDELESLARSTSTRWSRACASAIGCARPSGAT